MDYQLRPFDITTDLSRIVEIRNSFEPHKVTREELERNYAIIPQGSIRCEMVAVNAENFVVGWGFIGRPPWGAEGRFFVMIGVDPAYQHLGIGSQIYEQLTQFAISNGAKEFETYVSDNLDASIKFIEKRGFTIDRHVFEASLEVSQFDETPYLNHVDQVKAGGIDFQSFARLGDTPETRHKFYEALKPMFMDVPGSDAPFPPFEEWEKRTFEIPDFSSEGTVFALDGERWVGISWLAYYHEEDTLLNAFTGIDQAYRGRKIALALKLLNIQYARERGIHRIKTYNDSLNAPMLAINRKLGYQPAPGLYRMRKCL